MRRLLIFILLITLCFCGELLNSSIVSNVKVEDGKKETIITSTVPSDQPDKEEEIIYTYKTYEDYFIDNFNLPNDVYSIDETTQKPTIDYTQITREQQDNQTKLSYNNETFFTITSEDLVGVGTENNPYVVNSTKGYYFLTNKSLSGLSIENKHIELNCDVVLNNEKFDEQGNVSGGDGNYYRFKNTYSRIETLKGNGHLISGLYIVDNHEEKTSASMFSYIKKVSDLTIENFFLSAHNVYGISGNISEIRNSEVRSGTMIATNVATGFASQIDIIDNCANNILIKNAEYAHGFTRQANKSITNCTSYSQIIIDDNITGSSCSLFASNMSTGGGRVENCVNYGKAYAPKAAYVAAFLCDPGWGMTGEITIKNCVDYGELVGKGYVGSMIALARYKITIMNCKVYSKITGAAGNPYTGQIISSPYSYADIVIRECLVDTSNNQSVVGSMVGTSAKQVVIDKCVFNLKRSEKSYTGILCANPTCADYKITNCDINIDSLYTESLLGSTSMGKDSCKNIVVKNVKVTGKISIIENQGIYTSRTSLTNFVCDGVILDLENQNIAYGNDFSAFFVEWKTGKIYNKNMRAGISFQSVLSEEILINKGYKKIEL